eukprot:5752264-Ditylum_brightwellii.AAC.1
MMLTHSIASDIDIKKVSARLSYSSKMQDGALSDVYVSNEDDTYHFPQHSNEIYEECSILLSCIKNVPRRDDIQVSKI